MSIKSAPVTSGREASPPRLRGLFRLLAACALVLMLAPAPAALAAEDFQAWLGALRSEALAEGITQETVDAALFDLQPIPKVLELDRRQPEFTLTLDEYLGRVVNEARIQRGLRLLAENRQVLEAVAERFGVQPRFIVALWGIESDFGRLTGGFQVIPALATLAHDGRRSAYFRKELLNALRIADAHGIAPATMLGSWAGAMGQSQFMPSSYLTFAVDFDGDGRPDIWGSRPDVFASAANYLAKSGWKGDQTWGRQVRLPAGFDAAAAEQGRERPLQEWRDRGLRRADGGELPVRDDMTASLLLPAGADGPAYLVYNNFKTLLRWNRSNFFALAVGRLADRLTGG